MKRNNTWKWLLVIGLVAYSIYKMYPPTSRDLIEVFREEAVSPDATFNSIVKKADDLRAEDAKKGVDKTYSNLKEAIGTNSLKQYFPQLLTGKEGDPNASILNKLQRKAAGKIKLGLDLRGGTSFLMGMDTSTLATNADRGQALSQAVEVLRRRVDKLGVAEPLIQPEGEDRILVQLPGISESEKENARRQLQQAAFLEFRLVHPRSQELLAKGQPVAGYVTMTEIAQRESKKAPQTYLVEKKPRMTGDRIKQAGWYRDPMSNKPQISFRLDSQGTKEFGDLTRAHQGELLAIILDGNLYSAPVIKQPIETGEGVISGEFTAQEAADLANTLENPLQAPVKILEERSVDPSLGNDAIRSGITASIVGVIAVAAFMAIYYMIGGMVANFAVVLNVLICMGFMCALETTLTLPGIAGIVLTIGMAVDANVLIFERIREELAAGKSMRGALMAGYDRAFSTILDSHVTTLIASIILIFMGTGPVRGFGVTLTIGVALSMFTALVVTRLIFDWMLETGKLTNLKMLHLVRGSNIDFMKYAKPAFAASWLLIIIGIGYGIYRGSDIKGVDFAGGDTLTLRFDSAHKIDSDKLREAITKANIGEAQIQYQKELSTGTENLRVTSKYETGEKVEEALKGAFPEAKFVRLGLDKVGPLVGEEIERTAVWSALLAMFGILIYVAFRYEFSFAVGAIVAIIHDILMTLGIYFLTGHQLSAPMIAAILTIIGFSINDTIVIFDRIREDLKIGVKGSFKDLINKALNQTLSRTIITSGTVLLATLSLYIFGGGAIEDFAFTFLVGVITGTYSSIYIASALVLWWHRGERPKAVTPASVDTGGGATQAPARA